MVRKFVPSGNINRDIQEMSIRINELIDRLSAEPSPRSATKDGLRIARTENKNAVIEGTVDGIKYQTIMTPMSEAGRNTELHPFLTLRSKTIEASSDTTSVKDIGILYVDNSDGAILIGGFKRGEYDNQVLFVVPIDSGLAGGSVTLEDQEGVSDVDIYCGSGDVVLADAHYGNGAVLVYCRATDHWHVVAVNQV